MTVGALVFVFTRGGDAEEKADGAPADVVADATASAGPGRTTAAGGEEASDVPPNGVAEGAPDLPPVDAAEPVDEAGDMADGEDGDVGEAVAEPADDAGDSAAGADDGEPSAEGGAEAVPTSAPTGAAGDSPTERPVDDPRAPSLIPPGTPEENAESFLTMPLGVSDGAPLGGIGKDGIHLDQFTIGSELDGRDCSGKHDDFSVEGRDTVTLCFRVVQRRQESTVMVLWEREGETIRRSVVNIKPTHGYRTRVKLALREEYVGGWTARILSEDEIELARRSFRVVP